MQNHLENKAYAGFFVRLAAFAVDSLLAAIIVGIVKLPFSMASMYGVGFLKADFIFRYSFLDVFSYAGIAAYFVLLTYFSHSTPGKLLFRLEVVTKNGEWTFLNILYRETVGRFLSSLLCIGYLAVLVQGEKQGFHDMLCDTYVVYRNMAAVSPQRPLAAAGVGTVGGGTVPPNSGSSSQSSPAVSAFLMEESHPVPTAEHTFVTEETGYTGKEDVPERVLPTGEPDCPEETPKMEHSYDNMNPDSSVLNINKK
ncbi:MAG: RDD family protein [Lachnospiraceae bacterium]|nr:RDD family protein [Lachnospiraceae bacterium]